VSKVCQYLKLSHCAPKQSLCAQLCSHLFGYHYENYAGIIHQGLHIFSSIVWRTGTSMMRQAIELKLLPLI